MDRAPGRRRNFANLACVDVGALLLSDVGRWAVAWAGIKSSEALFPIAHEFHKDREGATLRVIPMGSDGINSRILRKRPLSVADVDVVAFASWPQDLVDPLQDGMHCRRWVDLLIVEHKQARGTLAQLKTHTKSIWISRLRFESVAEEEQDSIIRWLAATVAPANLP